LQAAKATERESTLQNARIILPDSMRRRVRRLSIRSQKVRKRSRLPSGNPRSNVSKEKEATSILAIGRTLYVEHAAKCPFHTDYNNTLDFDLRASLTERGNVELSP
jgi:hypothetical protein